MTLISQAYQLPGLGRVCSRRRTGNQPAGAVEGAWGSKLGSLSLAASHSSARFMLRDLE